MVPNQRAWERAEIERSALEALDTPESALSANAANLARYCNPPPDSPFPLEYSFASLGEVAGRAVLDLGCGSGENSVKLAHRGATTVGVDISEPLIRLARKRYDRYGLLRPARFVIGSAHDLPVKPSSIDAVLGISILHHLHL